MKTPIALAIPALCLGLLSCGESDPDQTSVIETPANAKVDLSQVQMKISKAKINRINANKYNLEFDYTLINKAGAAISFQSIYSGKDELIEVNLSDKNQDPLFLGKRPLEGLTLTHPRAILIPKGKSTRHLKVPVMPEVRQKGDPITVRVRLHAPSRYDELRTSVEAPLISVPWPQSPEAEAEQDLSTPDPEEYPLTSPVRDATPLPQR